MKRLQIFSIILILILFDSIVTAQENKGTIRIEIEGFINNEGMARVLIFSVKDKEHFPSNDKKATRRVILPIKNQKVIYEFDQINYGDYAISVHHDINNDSEVNTNFLGIPTEGVGFSNNVKLLFGPPSFEKAKFTLNKKFITLKILIKN